MKQWHIVLLAIHYCMCSMQDTAEQQIAFVLLPAVCAQGGGCMCGTVHCHDVLAKLPEGHHQPTIQAPHCMASAVRAHDSFMVQASLSDTCAAVIAHARRRKACGGVVITERISQPIQGPPEQHQQQQTESLQSRSRAQLGKKRPLEM